MGNDGPFLKVKNEMTQLGTAVEIFQKKFGVSYLPSRIKLSETCNYPERDRPGTLDADSVAYLNKLWPRLDLSPGTRIDWNGDGKIEGDWILEGDECLVFFLGGVTVGDGDQVGQLGFARNPANPLDRESPEFDGPFFNFASSRLKDLHGRRFYSYLDYWEQTPFAYFSAYGVSNGYNRYGGSDCPSLGVWPYAEELGASPRFSNSDSFQILSAGDDGRFGPGTKDAAHTWTPAAAASVPQEGRDDLSNFHDRPLGVAR
jgi:hypothetical protein